MGDLPSLDDIAKRNFPTAHDYSAAITMVRQKLQTMYEQNKIHGAAFHGSSINHEVKIGTDIDVFVVANTINACLDDIRRIYSEVKENHKITVELEPLISYAQANQGQHGIQRSFWGILDLQIQPDNVIGENPLEYLKENTATSPAQEFIGKKRNDLRRIVKGLTAPAFSEHYLKSLSRMLNYTVFIPRHIYHVMNGHLHPDEIMTKNELREMYIKDFKQIDPLALNLAYIFQKRKEKILSNENINSELYQDLILWLGKYHPVFERFILDNMALAKTKLDKKKK